jgi:predicted ester cyclase
MSDDAVRVARRWFDEVWNKRRRETIYELMAPGTVGHSPTGNTTGPEEWERFWRRLTGAFSDISVDVDAAVSDGRNVVVRWSGTMTHSGPGLGIQPTGRQVRIHGMTWMVVEGGRIVEGWDGWDSTGMLVAVGGASVHPDVARAASGASPSDAAPGQGR